MLRRRMSGLMATICLAGLAATACDDGGTGPRDSQPPNPVPGQLAVTLISPEGLEGAAVFETPDPGILGVQAEAGDAYFFQSADVGRIIVILEVPGTIRFTMDVEDLDTPPELRLVEVADTENRLRPDLSIYGIDVQPVEGASS